jgi:ribosomal-protein-alanine N-acetyltransferase
MSASSFAALPPLVGPRTLLRPAQADDRDAFLAAAQASVTLHAPWVTAPSDEAAFDAWLHNAGPSFHPMLLVNRDDGGLAGVYNLSQLVLGNFCSAYLGAYAFAPHAGRGLMAEGLALLLHHAFERAGLHRVEANIQPGNTRSIKLFERGGFKREGLSPRYLRIGGLWCDHERWALTVEDWRG